MNTDKGLLAHSLLKEIANDLKDESIKLAHFPACAFLFTYPMLSGATPPFDGLLFLLELLSPFYGFLFLQALPFYC